MTDHEFDHALVAAALAEAAETGWRTMSIAAAARRAELPLARARSRFPVRLAVLMRLGEQADRTALEGAGAEGDAASPLPARELLFDMLMRRLDVLQEHRMGVLALFEALPSTRSPRWRWRPRPGAAWYGCWKGRRSRRPHSASPC